MVPYGGFWRRFAAFIIDTIILQVAMTFVMSIFGVGAGLANLADPAYAEAAGIGAALSMVGFSFVGQWLYFSLMECSGLQATVGKLALGVIVTDEHGNRISFGRATGRYFAKILSGLILLVGYIMVAFTERKQGLHDMIAGTLVYKTRDVNSVRSSASVFE